jgi:hypothetical protein
VAFQVLAVLVNIISFIIIVMYVFSCIFHSFTSFRHRKKIGDSHFDGPHQVIGLVVLIFSLVQPILGLVSHLLFDSARSGPPFFPDKVLFTPYSLF